ncbi:hypothetical protein D9756_002028 [Leucocoprinus leucothites]|uniref:Uncharacterized protein n=1 Tax=Leucocoprinus leucothites TaxID=201217 RepID=A0A8H5LLU6_9AGAR|nr:hypothetical protein D9756_002028 [Leucoagaricus leucothites]
MMSIAAAMSRTRRAASLLLLFCAFFVDQVACKGGKGGGGRKGGGSDFSGDSSSLNLDPGLTAVFAITIIIAVFTLYQLGRSANRLKKPVLPPGAPTLQYDVGKLFLWTLFSYLVIYLLWNILFAVFIVVDNGIAISPLAAGVYFVGQASDVLFLGMVLAIIAYRQRIQLNPGEKLFNLKSFLDGWVLSTMLLLGVAQDALLGAAMGGMIFPNSLDILNFSIAYEAFNFVASMNVIGTAIMAYRRMNKSGITDNILRSAALFVSPFIFIRALYRIIAVGLTANVRNGVFIDRETLFIVTTVIGGVTSIIVAGLCLFMGAPPTPKKGDKNKDVQYEPVKV